MKILSFFLLFLFSFRVFSQVDITGIIKDEKTKEGIPFASVGVVGTTKGTLSNEKGEFKLQENQFTGTDTIRISSIGYSSFSIPAKDLRKSPENIIYLTAITYDLSAVTVKPDMTARKILGTGKYYNKGICTAFTGKGGNWRGEQAAIRVTNTEKNPVFIESFFFYILKNEYTDSLQFRVMMYEVDTSGFPGKTFLKKPILFKTNLKSGLVGIDLKDRGIHITGDFFISLECLEEKMESTKFCFMGAIKLPSYFKPSPFERWGRVRGGGDFSVEVSYLKSGKK